MSQFLFSFWMDAAATAAAGIGEFTEEAFSRDDVRLTEEDCEGRVVVEEDVDDIAIKLQNIN